MLFSYGIANLRLMVLYGGICHPSPICSFMISLRSQGYTGLCGLSEKLFCHVFIACSVLHFTVGYLLPLSIQSIPCLEQPISTTNYRSSKECVLCFCICVFHEKMLSFKRRGRWEVWRSFSSCSCLGWCFCTCI